MKGTTWTMELIPTAQQYITECTQERLQTERKLMTQGALTRRVTSQGNSWKSST